MNRSTRIMLSNDCLPVLCDRSYSPLCLHLLFLQAFQYMWGLGELRTAAAISSGWNTSCTSTAFPFDAIATDAPLDSRGRCAVVSDQRHSIFARKGWHTTSPSQISHRGNDAVAGNFAMCRALMTDYICGVESSRWRPSLLITVRCCRLTDHNRGVGSNCRAKPRVQCKPTSCCMPISQHPCVVTKPSGTTKHFQGGALKKRKAVGTRLKPQAPACAS